MAYEQLINRATPGCFLFLLDQSGSMELPLGGLDCRKCDQLAIAINSCLRNMCLRATGDEGVKHWMDVGVIGYTNDTHNLMVGSILQGRLAGQSLVSLPDLYSNPLEQVELTTEYLDEDTGEMVTDSKTVPLWIKPQAVGGTPMCNALHTAYTILEPWVQAHPNSFPPVVIHITDGESTDGEPLDYAEGLQGLATNDGNVLVFNCHLSETAADPFIFPASDELLPDAFAKDLFRMSSVLPDTMAGRAKAEGFELQPNARAMAFNADMVVLLKLLDMGTRPATAPLR